MRALRILLKLLAALAIAPMLLLGVVYGLLKSGLLGDHVDGLITLLAKKDGVFFVRAEGVSGDLPEHLVVKKVEIGDGTDVYLTIENAEAWWHPLDLFHPFDHTKWKVNVDEIHAERVTWTQLPHPAKPDPEPFRWDKFVRIVVGHLRIDDFDLRGSLLGGAVERVRAEGSGVLGEWEHGFVKLELEHIDERSGRASIDLSTYGSPLELWGRVTAEEGPGGALAALARLDDAGAVKLDVRVSGQMRDWHAEADVTAANIGVLRAKAGLSFNAHGPFDVSGTFDPAPLQRQRYLVGEGQPIALSAKGNWAPDVELRLDRVVLDADGRELAADGRLDLATHEFQVRGNLVNRREGERVHLTILDALAARLKGSGVLGDGGRLEATLDVDAPLLEGVEAQAFQATLKAADEKGDSVPTFDLAAAARGLVLDGQPIPVVGGEARLVASGRIDLPAGVLKAERATLDGGDLSLKGPVEFGDHWKTMTAALRAEAASLASLERFVGAKVSGRASGTVDFAAKSEWKQLDAKARLEVADAVVADAGWNALVGGRSVIEASVARTPDGAGNGRVDLKAAGIQAGGEGQWKPGGKDFVADGRAVLDNLSRLAEPARAKLAGRLEATAKMRGRLDLFDATLALKGERLAAGGVRFDSLTADVDAKGLPHAWTATVRSRGRQGKDEATLDGTFSMPAPHRLLARNLALRGPRTQASADLDVDLERMLASGTLRVDASDLTVWRRMTGIDLAGALDVDLTLAADGGVQKASGTVKVTRGQFLAGGTLLAAEGLDLTLDRVVLGSRPQGLATLRASRLRYGTATLVAGSLTASGDGRLWAFDTSVDVRDVADLRLASSGTLQPGPPLELRVEKLAGTLDTMPVSLTNPTVVRVDGASWSVDSLALAVGREGRITGDASRTAGTMRVVADAANLPLEFASVFAPSLDLSGTIDASVRLEGPDFASSKGQVLVHGRQLGSTGLEHQGVAPVNADAELNFGGRRLRGEASAIGLADSRLELTMEVPLTAGPTDTPLAIDLLWKGSVAEVSALLPTGEDAVGGRIDANLHLGGTAGSPRVTGRAVLVDGVWENAATGLVLRNLGAELVGSGSELKLVRFDATDGEKGKVRATGGVAFGRFPAFDAEFTLDAERAMLARLDVVSSRADVHLELKASRAAAEGSAVGGSLTGSVRLDEARLEIPQRFVSDVPEIEVTEIGEDVDVLAKKMVTPARAALDLDVSVVADNRIFLTGRGLESEWASDVHVRGTTADPRVEGTIRSVHGQMSLLGRRFDVESGLLRFDGAPGNIPYLTLTARADANDITAIASVTGPATTPTLELRSEPPLPRDEVLSRVLFGQSAASLTPLQSVQLARSVAELTGSPLGGGGELLTGIGRTFGFDRLAIESSGADGAAALTASRYLTDNVYLRVQQGLTPETSKLSLEWQVMKHLTIESDVSQDAQGEVGATWRWDY